ncbi:MAG: hypothetical protein ABSD72_08715 [Terracidiphilus sp.]|jgi:hypothetical protein
MPTHNPNEPDGNKPEEIDASKGYEATDVRVSGILIFLVALSIFAAVTAALAYGVGKMLDARMAKEDGPTSKWTKTVDVRQLGDMPNSPELQNKVATLMQQYPTPRLQTDDGAQDIADLHAREDLLLNNYSWVDQSQGKVRIPIERAMDLIAQRGLPVATSVEQTTLMTGDLKPQVLFPLTSGFARTGYELDQAEAQAVEGTRAGEQK